MFYPSVKNHDILVPNMDDMFVVRGRKRRSTYEIKNLHRYQVEMFHTVLDTQLYKLHARFNVASTQLLLCMSCLSPSNSFYNFDQKQLVHFAEYYPYDFSSFQLQLLSSQLDTYIVDMRSSSDFSDLDEIGNLARLLVETGRHKVYPLVYLLLTLALVLPVATATVERAFSAMNIIKNRLRNRMGDEWLNDSLVIYIENEVLEEVSNDAIMENFQKMKTRRGQL